MSRSSTETAAHVSPGLQPFADLKLTALPYGALKHNLDLFREAVTAAGESVTSIRYSPACPQPGNHDQHDCPEHYSAGHRVLGSITLGSGVTIPVQQLAPSIDCPAGTTATTPTLVGMFEPWLLALLGFTTQVTLSSPSANSGSSSGQPGTRAFCDHLASRWLEDVNADPAELPRPNTLLYPRSHRAGASDSARLVAGLKYDNTMLALATDRPATPGGMVKIGARIMKGTEHSVFVPTA